MSDSLLFYSMCVYVFDQKEKWSWVSVKIWMNWDFGNIKISEKNIISADVTILQEIGSVFV